MDFVILIATDKILKNHAKIWRVITASVLGGIYSVLAYYPLFNNFALKLIVPIILCLITFNYHSFYAFLKNILAFYASSLILAGSISAVFNIFDFDSSFPIKTFIITTIIAFIILSFTTKTHKISKKQDEAIKEIEIKLFGKTKTFKALKDTGNLTGATIIEYEKIKDILPKDFREKYENDDTYYSLLGKYKFDIIPCQTTSGTNLLLALPDGDKKIALTKECLSHDDKFQAII